MTAHDGPPAHLLLHHLSQAVLAFDADGKLVYENAAARDILGADLKLLRHQGWYAAVVLFQGGPLAVESPLEAARQRAERTGKPTRFTTLRYGEYIPCWVTTAQDSGHAPLTLLTIELPDWSALGELFDRYLQEVRAAADATIGHSSLILNTALKPRPKETTEHLGKRVSGFARLIETHMFRLNELTGMMARMSSIRTNRLRDETQAACKRIVLADFFEDLIEGLAEGPFLDPETDDPEFRRRLVFYVPGDVAVAASPSYLAAILRDILRNAIMYSLKAAPIHISAHTAGNIVQIDIMDEGYGIRESERERVFMPFMRARQPQIIGEFGYGLSLYLCKHEIEAMGGRLWFDSEEGKGSTFSLKLPTWRATTE
ncbi:MAG: ATP-binding protein [Anaerolineae bacterium]